jgi:hypothetical protein
MRSSEGKLGLTLLQKVLQNEEQEQQQQQPAGEWQQEWGWGLMQEGMHGRGDGARRPQQQVTACQWHQHSPCSLLW